MKNKNKNKIKIKITIKIYSPPFILQSNHKFNNENMINKLINQGKGRAEIGRNCKSIIKYFYNNLSNYSPPQNKH